MMTSKMETVTPEKAANWLSRSKNPRPLRNRHVQNFVRHLQNRTFELTHQGIALDENGFLVDGQHRLTAIVETGQEVDMFVARGIALKGVTVVDRGAKRDNSVVLRCSPAVSQVITFAAKIGTGMSAPMEYDLARFKRVLEGYTELLLESYAMKQRRLSSAPIKVGAVVNMVEGDGDWVCKQWKAFNTGDFPNQSRSVQWLYRRVMGDRSITPHGMLVYSFKAFNKANSSGQSMTVKNIDANVAEIRKVLRQMAGLSLETNGE